MIRSVSSVLAVVIVLLAGLLSSVPLSRSADPVFAVSGVVVSDAGAPVEGAQVSGFSGSPDGSSSSSDSVVSGKDGSFALHLAGGKGSVSVFFAKWRASDSREVVVSGDVSDLRFVLKTPPPKSAAVVGVVSGPDGSPFEGATVHIGQGCCYLYAGETKGAPPPSEPQPSDASGPSSSNASGATSSGSSGSAVASRPFYYDGDDQDATTGPDGAFRFVTYAGPRVVSASAKGFAQSTVTVQAVDGQSVRADLKLQKVPARDAVLHGRVLDAVSGLPLAGAGVSLNNIEWNRFESASSDASGAFSFVTLPGWSMLSVYYYGEPVAIRVDDAVGGSSMPIRGPGVPLKQYYNFVETLFVKSGDASLDIRLEPKPEASVALLGYVVDPAAKRGVPGASVSVWNQDTGDWGSATTDEVGSFRIMVRPGHYSANAFAPGHLQGAVMFVVLEGAASKRVDIDVPAGEAKYAPCDDCVSPMPMEKGVVSSSPPGAAASGGNLTGAPPGANSSRAAVYAGSGGGLPPYAPDDAAGVGAPSSGTAVPFGGVLVAVVGLALAAIALRRGR